MIINWFKRMMVQTSWFWFVVTLVLCTIDPIVLDRVFGVSTTWLYVLDAILGGAWGFCLMAWRNKWSREFAAQALGTKV